MIDLNKLSLRLAYRQQRTRLLGELGEAFQRGEPMRQFLDGEIQNAINSRDKQRRTLLTALLRRLVLSGGEIGNADAQVATQSVLCRVFYGIAPDSDMTQFAAIDAADQTLQPEALQTMALMSTRQTRILLKLSAIGLAAFWGVAFCAIVTAITLRIVIDSDKISQQFMARMKDTPPPATQFDFFNSIARSLTAVLDSYGIALLVLVIFLTFLTIYALPRMTGRTRAWLDRLPPFSLYRDFQAGSLLTALGLLLQSGKRLSESVETAYDSSKGWRRWRLKQIIIALRNEPSNYVAAFSQGLLSTPMLSRAATLYRTSSDFGAVIKKMGIEDGALLEKRILLSAAFTTLILSFSFVVVASVMSLASLTIPTAMNSALTQQMGARR